MPDPILAVESPAHIVLMTHLIRSSLWLFNVAGIIAG